MTWIFLKLNKGLRHFHSKDLVFTQPFQGTLLYHQLFLSEAAQDYSDHFNDAETDFNSKGNRGRKRGDRKHLGGTGRQLKRNKPKRK